MVYPVYEIELSVRPIDDMHMQFDSYAWQQF